MTAGVLRLLAKYVPKRLTRVVLLFWHAQQLDDGAGVSGYSFAVDLTFTSYYSWTEDETRAHLRQQKCCKLQSDFII